MEDFNAAKGEAATRDVLACCESTAFAKLITDGRPYPDADTLDAAIDTAFEALTWEDIVEAMNAHPRIGARTGGCATPRKRSSPWSGRNCSRSPGCGCESC